MNLGADIFRLSSILGSVSYPAYLIAPAALKLLAKVSFGELDNPIYKAAYD
jgi:3-polyprenyl-4-hydroxybenzoate decarboxylase